MSERDKLKGKLAQLRADVEAGHEHPSVSLLRFIDIVMADVGSEGNEGNEGSEGSEGSDGTDNA